MPPPTFHQSPILNSPYSAPTRHWALDDTRQPTNAIHPSRRAVSFITPIPKPSKAGGKKQQQNTLTYDAESQRIADGSADGQQYELTALISGLRQELAAWRELPPAQWNVTPETARLLQHWRHHPFSDIRPFFCQVEAVETAIWLAEVAPRRGNRGRNYLERIQSASEQANPGLSRLALKLATGAGKTAVMAMLIAWQTINAARHPNSRRFTRGFLVVAPGITIRDRLRVLQPNDPDSYYQRRELVPADMLPDLDRAKIVITNYHAFQRRQTLELSSGSRALLQGHGPALDTLETEGQMLGRVCPELLAMKGILVLNDEAHHCYREKPGETDEGALTGDDRREAKRNTEAARLWISDLEAAQRKIGLRSVIDLSATPFFLRGSGYAEGTLFPWTASDFSLMDAIECGIVKLPRVPVVDNIPGAEMPMYRNLWDHIGKKMPKGQGQGQGKQSKQSKQKGESTAPDPFNLPPELQTALEALYGHYEKTFRLWQEKGMETPPCFIVVCNNIRSSKLVCEYIAGCERESAEGERIVRNGRLELFRNFDANDEPFPLPRTLLINSEQLESGEAIDKSFREAAADEIDRFRRETIDRTGDRQQAEKLTDEDILREVMNTVGKPGRLGGGIRCVVSVAMLTEGWDANNVTHVLGLRAFGTQLLCEQVIGRSLRRQSYQLNHETGLFNPEYADVFGIPFDFTAKPVFAPPQPPADTVHVQALSPAHDAAEIHFPRVTGYRLELPGDILDARFTEDSKLTLTPELVGPTITRNQGIVGEGHDLDLKHLDAVRDATIAYHLASRLLYTHYRDPDNQPKLHLFGQLKRISRQWLNSHLECKGNTQAAQLTIPTLADMACERIKLAIDRGGQHRAGHREKPPVIAMLDPDNPTGSTRAVNFVTSKTRRYRPSALSAGPAAKPRCHLNWAILDSDWEGEFCRVLDAHPRILAWVKNHNLGFSVPYRFSGETRQYIPDFIALLDDGRGADDPLRLVVEVKGLRGEDAKMKKETMNTHWVPGVNAHTRYGRWAFLEFTDAHEMQDDFDAAAREALDRFAGPVGKAPADRAALC